MGSLLELYVYMPEDKNILTIGAPRFLAAEARVQGVRFQGFRV